MLKWKKIWFTGEQTAAAGEQCWGRGEKVAGQGRDTDRRVTTGEGSRPQTWK